VTDATRRGLLAALPAIAVAGSVATVASAQGTDGRGFSGPLTQVANRAALAALGDAFDGRQAVLSEGGRFGLFVFTAADSAALVAIDPGEGVAVAPASDRSGARGAWVRAGFRHDGVTPEMFGFVPEDGATAANDLAFERCVALASDIRWREIHAGAKPHEVEALPIRLAAGKYRYGGAGIDYSRGGNTKSLDIRGKGRRRTMMVIERDVFLFTWDDTSSLDIHGIHFVGGKGVYVQTAAGNNVRDAYRVSDVRADGFSVCAFGSNSEDMPLWSITYCVFAGGDNAIAIAFPGNTDLCEVAYTEFFGMRYHIKAGYGGNCIRLHDNFHANTAHPDGARVWAVLDGSNPNAGGGGVMRDCKMGNEWTVNLADRPFLLAEQAGGGGNFYERAHSNAVSAAKWEGWHFDGNVFLGNSGQSRPLFTFHTASIDGMTFTSSNKIKGSRRPWVFGFADGIREVAAGSRRRNDIHVPVEYGRGNRPAAGAANLPGFAGPREEA
jgi:hypothetical protein